MVGAEGVCRGRRQGEVQMSPSAAGPTLHESACVAGQQQEAVLQLASQPTGSHQAQGRVANCT